MTLQMTKIDSLQMVNFNVSKYVNVYDCLYTYNLDANVTIT